MYIGQVYEKYAPYQFLVYWFELRQGYEDLFGSLADMDPDDYAKATGMPYAPVQDRDASYCLYCRAAATRMHRLLLYGPGNMTALLSLSSQMASCCLHNQCLPRGNSQVCQCHFLPSNNIITGILRHASCEGVLLWSRVLKHVWIFSNFCCLTCSVSLCAGHIMRAGAAAAASGAAVAKGPEIPQLAAAVAAETSNTVAPIDVIVIPLSEGAGARIESEAASGRKRRRAKGKGGEGEGSGVVADAAAGRNGMKEERGEGVEGPATPALAANGVRTRSRTRSNSAA